MIESETIQPVGSAAIIANRNTESALQRPVCAALTGEPSTRVITARPGLRAIDLAEIWRFRDLLFLLTSRDITVRYKQAVAGVGWAVLQPAMMMLVFTVFFGKLGGMDHRTGGTPYPVYVLAALLPWTFFSTALTNCSISLVGNYNLITKVYFPRLVIPIATVMASLFDLAVSMLLLGAVLIYYRLPLTGQVFGSLVALLGLIAISIGLGSLLAALTVEYRDFRYIAPFMVQIWMFLTPVIYPAAIVPHHWRLLYSLNPMVGLIDGFRAGLLGRPFPWPEVGGSLAASLVILIAGAMYFRIVERRFADVI
jgi:lipopolysaccharide transport system permease protein